MKLPNQSSSITRNVSGIRIKGGEIEASTHRSIGAYRMGGTLTGNPSTPQAAIPFTSIWVCRIICPHSPFGNWCFESCEPWLVWEGGVIS
jgi:hypothetical protein